MSRQVGFPQPVCLPATSIKSLTAKLSPAKGPSAVGDSSNLSTNAPLRSAVTKGVDFITLTPANPNQGESANQYE